MLAKKHFNWAKSAQIKKSEHKIFKFETYNFELWTHNQNMSNVKRRKMSMKDVKRDEMFEIYGKTSKRLIR